MRDVTRKIGSTTIALLLVTTVMLSPLAGPASMTQTASAEMVNCDYSPDEFLGGAWFNTITGNTDGCHWSSGDEQDYENVTATDAYASALGSQDSATSYNRTTSNFMQNTRTVAMSKGKIDLVNGLNNGSSESVVHNSVNKTVLDYYSRMEMDMLNDYNARVMQAYYWHNSTDATVVRRYGSASGDTSSFSGMQPTNYTYTLVNGSTTNITVFDDGNLVIGPSASGINYGGDSVQQQHVEVVDPSGTGSNARVVDQDMYGSLFEKPSDQSSHVIDNFDPYVTEVYSQYAAGEIDSTDLAMNDPSVIANEASTSFNSTGHYSHAAIMLASIGAAGNINVSHTVETGDGTVLNGTLYYTADDVPADGWQNNVTYNFSDYNGSFYFAVAGDDGNGSLVDLSNYGQNFTITEATNTKTGERVSATKVQTYTYDSTNASALAEEMDRLQQLRDRYEEQLQSGSGGDTGTDWQKYAIAAGIGVVAVLYAQSRD